MQFNFWENNDAIEERMYFLHILFQSTYSCQFLLSIKSLPNLALVIILYPSRLLTFHAKFYNECIQSSDNTLFIIVRPGNRFLTREEDPDQTFLSIYLFCFLQELRNYKQHGRHCPFILDLVSVHANYTVKAWD